MTGKNYYLNKVFFWDLIILIFKNNIDGVPSVSMYGMVGRAGFLIFGFLEIEKYGIYSARCKEMIFKKALIMVQKRSQAFWSL